MNSKNAAALYHHKKATINQPLPHVGERGGNHLCLVQKHTKNISNTHLTPFAELLYAMPLSTHGVIETSGGKEKYLLNISQKKSFTRSVRQINFL